MDDVRRLRVLRQHVMTDQLLGAVSVPLGVGPGTLAIAADDAPVDEAEHSRPPAPRPPAAAASAPARPPAPVADAPRSRPARAVEPLGKELSAKQKVVALRQLDENEVRACTRCGLHEGRIQTVFGEGDPNAQLLFIGEGPGQMEDEQGRPFVGRSGDLLTKMIVAMGLSREQIFIANVVKCRPPQNRTPTPAEIDACTDHLLAQIRIIRPRVIVTLGGPATKYMLHNERGITAIRGIWHQWHGLGEDHPILVMPTFHPAYLLRQYTPENRKKVWSDLQKVMAVLNGEEPEIG